MIINNNTAIGYMILAAKALGASVGQIKYLEAEMKYQLDTKTGEQAMQAYNKF